MSEKADKCTRNMVVGSALCSAYPKNKIAKCLARESKIFEKCVSSSTSGISSGDSGSLTTSVGTSPYRKSDGRVYINSGDELPFNGKVWNGKCYAYYINGELRYFTDRNDNACDNEGVLNSNNFN